LPADSTRNVTTNKSDGDFNIYVMPMAQYWNHFMTVACPAGIAKKKAYSDCLLGCNRVRMQTRNILMISVWRASGQP